MEETSRVPMASGEENPSLRWAGLVLTQSLWEAMEECLQSKTRGALGEPFGEPNWAALGEPLGSHWGEQLGSHRGAIGDPLGIHWEPLTNY